MENNIGHIHFAIKIMFPMEYTRNVERSDIKNETFKIFTGILMHGHFKPYYQYDQITHA